MKSHFGTALFLLVLLFVAWIFVASTPLDRMSRTCSPVNWSGKMVVSLTSLVSPSFSGKVQKFFDDRFSDCRFVIWEQFYEDDFNKMKAQVLQEKAAK